MSGGDVTRIGFIKRAILAGAPGPLAAAATVLAAVAAPTLIQLAIGPYVGQHAVFAAYFPAIMLATALLGWHLGLLTAILSALVASYLLMPPAPGLSLSAADLGSVACFVVSAALIVVFADTLRRTFIELEATARREAVLAAELGHRAKNNLLMIGALARQTRRSGKGEEGFFEALTPRIDALARAQDLLKNGDWKSCALPALAVEALRPFSHPGLSVEGPDCTLPAAVCTPLVLAFHELATNAIKYGALSSPGGRVEVRWSIEPGSTRLRLDWRERDGPPVGKPKQRGLGSRLLARGNPLVDIEHLFRKDGVRCVIRIEGAHIAAPGDPA